ncbi:acyl-CoA N-acyltransferase [Didymella exigua CBS 183.55]|uniref:Acyl-CoA N-acyltransferase n=1 Tax=Didymella exigua CBS 183.55 TaxID=1150837 RepID=A0A6A5RPH4_9PLEO|nr:acyl-CoA N-acyltransferase [Didymella exigua CBS 183.55]KAF1929048.1 acyl-CoA N-acyltransferase [Didymella exigua CBS 183.55]
MAAQPTPAHPAAMTAQVSPQADPQTTTATTTASPLPKPIFTAPRLLVRPLHPQDAPSMSRHADNPKVTEYMSLGFPSPYTLEAAHDWINMNLAPPILNWAICLSSSPETVVGGCGLKPGVDVQSHCAEIGYWIGEEHWGKGLITEMLRALTDWVFRSPHSLLAGEQGKRWTRLWGGIFQENKGSMRCFEKCGYVREGVLRGAVEKHGEASDMVVYGLLKHEWEMELLKTTVI